MQHKAFKFRIYPTKDQEVNLNKTFGCTRFLWNKLVENFNSYDPETNPKPEKINEQTLKHNPEYEWLKEVSNCALQQKCRDFEETKKQFFNKKRKVKLGRPKYKKKGGRESYRLTSLRFKLYQDQSIIRLEKIGYVKAITHRVIPEDADYRSVTVSKTPTGKFYVSILVQINTNVKPLTGKHIGIDLGLKDLFILSDGQVIDNPKWFRESQTDLKKAQQHLSRKKKGSKRREKQRIKVARIHEKIVNQRTNFLHEVSSAIVRDYDIICIEDLNVTGMLKNHKLAKAISDASWSAFTSMLDYKCNFYGKTLVKVDRFFPSSKTCSYCGHKMESMTLDIRNWTCPNCMTNHDRDWNAAVNIERKGFSDLVGEEFEPLNKGSSVEYIEYRHREVVSPRLFSNEHHLASSVKCLENYG